MEQNQVIETLFSTITNRTKLAVITLLVHRRRMTVTQMSKIIGTTRSNLYQIIGEMVDSGILNQPETVVKKNYVEKYYTLNETMFTSPDSEGWKKRLSSISGDQAKELLVAFLQAQSMNLQIMAQELQLSSPETVQKIQKMFSRDMFVLSYGRISDSSYEKFVEGMKEVTKSFSEDPEQDGDNMYLALGFPSIWR